MMHSPVVWHVDDNQADLDVIEEALGTERLRLRSFLDPLDAQDAFVVTPADDLPDLLLLDVNMPGLDGFQFLRLVNHDQRLAKMRVCVVSGGDVPREHEAMRRLGTSDVLRKPRTAAELPLLGEAVRGLLGLASRPATMAFKASH